MTAGQPGPGSVAPSGPAPGSSPHTAPALAAVRHWFTDYPGRYWITGGWAVDLATGRIGREHGDVDVMVLHRDLDRLTTVFADRDLSVLDHATGDRRRWDGTTSLVPGRDSLVTGPDAPHRIELVLGLDDGEDWLFHRGRRTRRRWDLATRHAPNGLLFLAPELVLLIKSRGTPRPQDDTDFAALVDLLDAEPAEWLLDRLAPPGGAPHRWAEPLRTRLRALDA